MSRLVVLRSVRAELPFEPTDDEAIVARGSAVTNGIMPAEIRRFRISVR